MKGRKVAFVAAAMICAGMAPVFAEDGRGIVVASVSAPMNPVPASATNAVATCPPGTQLVSGGVLGSRVNPTDPRPAFNGLRAKGSFPSDDAGVALVDGSPDPASWSGTVNFGNASEVADQVTSLALCATEPLTQRVVAVATVTGPVSPNPTAQITVNCPPGTSVLGGGALASPTDSPAFKPVGMFPSDAAGNMLPDGADNPTSWTAVGFAGSPAEGLSITAFAVCAQSVGLSTRVVRVDAPGARAASTFTTTTAGCGPDRLWGGGVLVDNPLGELGMGVHLRGSYPSDPLGAPATADAADPVAWSAIVGAGGLFALNTTAHVFAICSSPPSGSPPPSAEPTVY
jgi:hypothetical protein